MKIPHTLRRSAFLRIVATVSFALLGAGSIKAADFFTSGGVMGVDLSNAGTSVTSGKRWAIFALSGGVTITDSLTGDPDVLNDVYGDVGLAGSTTSAKLTLTNSVISGDIFRNSSSTFANSGGIYGSDNSLNTYNSILAQKAADAITASNNAYALARNVGSGSTLLQLGGGVQSSILTNNTTSLSLNNTAGSITGSANTNYVLNLNDLVLSGVNAVLTLSGTSTTNYVINVNRYLQLSQQAQIVLSGGLTSSNVLFNVAGTSTAPYDVSLSGNSKLTGTILTPNRNVKLTGNSYVYGTVIAKGVSLSGFSHVIQDVSP